MRPSRHSGSTSERSSAKLLAPRAATRRPNPPRGTDMLNKPALILATTLGTVLQVAMVVAGHSNTTIASLFAVGGMGISLLAGLLYTMRARGSTGASMTLGGAIAGGVSA